MFEQVLDRLTLITTDAKKNIVKCKPLPFIQSKIQKKKKKLQRGEGVLELW